MPSGLRDNNLKTRRHPASPEWTLLGCGALGGVFASLLTQSGQATRLLLRERHRATLHPGVDFTSLEGHTQLLAIERAFIDKPGSIKRLLVALQRPVA